LENNISIGCCVGMENDKEIRKELGPRNRYDSSGRTSHTIRKYLEAYLSIFHHDLKFYFVRTFNIIAVHSKRIEVPVLSLHTKELLSLDCLLARKGSCISVPEMK
jgi:hypothetical protein